MTDLISREKAIEACSDYSNKDTTSTEEAIGAEYCVEILKSLPSAEPEMITIEELSNQLGCATIQSALYWFEFLKTLDSLGFAIIRKETR